MQLKLGLNLLSVVLCAIPGLGVPQRRDTSIGATYFLTNDNRGNNVVIHEIISNGTVQYSGSVSTGGKGSSYGGPSTPGPDALRSQNSVVVSGRNLYAVNAGSDSISMFQISSDNPTQLRQVGRPVNSGGNFPVSIAVSSKTGNVCALNGGAINGVQCFKSTSRGLVSVPNSRRSLNLTETTPPSISNSSYSVSTILFSPDGSRLVVDVKGLVEGNVPGYLAVWNVSRDGSLSRRAQTFPALTQAGQQNFGMTYLNGKEGYVMADVIQGGLVYDFSNGYNSQYRVKDIVTPGQEGSCWVSYASKSNTYFFTDAGTEILNEYSIDDSSLDATLVAQHRLPVDVVVTDSSVGTFGGKQYLYQLAPIGASLFVLDVQPNGNSNVIQAFNFTQSLENANVPFTISLQGSAVYAKN